MKSRSNSEPISLFVYRKSCLLTYRRKIEKDPKILGFADMVIVHQSSFESFRLLNPFSEFFGSAKAIANNKDNYHGITLSPTLCKIYEMIILNRLEKFASQAGYFSEIGLDSRKDQAVLRHLLRYLKPYDMRKGVARCLVASLTSGKLLIQFGLMG